MKNIIILLTKVSIINSLTCDKILELPSDKKLTLPELQTIQPYDIVQCLAHLSKEKLPLEQANYIWRSIIMFYKGVSNVPDTVLMLLHWITPAVTPEDYRNITLDNIDVIQNFGLNYELNNRQLSAIADRIKEDFAGKEPEDYTYYDLIAFKQILCAFNRSEIERIQPSVYRETALMIGKLENCNPEVMYGFAKLAIKRKAFGPVINWSESTVKIVGKVAEVFSGELNLSKSLNKQKKELN